MDPKQAQQILHSFSVGMSPRALGLLYRVREEEVLSVIRAQIRLCAQDAPHTKRQEQRLVRAIAKAQCVRQLCEGDV